MFFKEYTNHVANQEKIRQRSADDARTEHRKLTISDTKLLRSFFGYTRVKQIPCFPTRKKKDAPIYIIECLWKNEEDDQDEVPELDLETLSSSSTMSLPKIFVANLEDLVQLFQEGSKLNETEQCAFVRLWQVSSLK